MQRNKKQQNENDYAIYDVHDVEETSAGVFFCLICLKRT
ncbi:hypothetical protein FSS13T_08970 [Flavobacterium saliperosum S13]|uniref:Uncharacterized protein n=1 Tax=Flavobacterium saliperosum S13 TaxID=1341155 RepID=A0ABN0QHH0_9FLAO|nr:hypothetical protein FSS13T_08970 [Flavobacterium saliperosum S13]